MPLDISGEYSPLTSWRVGKGMINSPMFWTTDCILYFHKSIKYSDIHPDVINVSIMDFINIILFDKSLKYNDI